MCSICAIADFERNDNLNPGILTVMGKTMKHRGPDENGMYLSPAVLMHHNRLSVMDVKNGKQPMTAMFENRKYTIIYNGEIYNTDELRAELKSNGASFKTNCDTEVVLWSYIVWKDDCVNKLNGIFAFAIYDEYEKRLFMARDRFGVKPFFYTFIDSTLLIASEIKALLAHPQIKPKMDLSGMWQMLLLSPVTLNGSGIFRDIYELKPGQRAVFSRDGMHAQTYWSLKAEPFTDSRGEAIYKTKSLLCDAIKRQLRSDVPLCEFLSGGLDSSVISSVASKHKRENGKKTDTYSFEYEGNRKNSENSLFQPEDNDEFALYMADFIGSNHTVLTAPVSNVASCIYTAVDARDFPGQADIDSSLLYYCAMIKDKHTVAVSGECSDEIFGGYPWFYRKEIVERDFFPWIHDPFARISLFRSELVRPVEGYRYLSDKYTKTVKECSLLEEDSEEMRISRIATHLSTNYFMTSLLERNDRMSMANAVELRVPFADHRIAEYVYNVPWEIKFENHTEKALLKNAMEDFLPRKTAHRKKSPYPKTHNPEYEKLVTSMLEKELAKKDSLFNEISDRKKIKEMLNSENSPHFSRSMTKPQLIAWLVQMSYWLEKYNVMLV